MKVFDIAPVKFIEGKMLILDQTKLPGEEVYIEAINKEDVWDAIYHLKVRGAPAIGVAAGYGLYISVRDYQAETADEFAAYVKETADYLNTSRPTAVNLSWALKRMVKVMEEYLAGCADALEMGKTYEVRIDKGVANSQNRQLVNNVYTFETVELKQKVEKLDTDRAFVKFYIDKDFVNENLIGIHPNDNTATIWLKTEDLLAIIKEHGNPVNVVEI